MSFFQVSKSATDRKIWSTRDINGSYSCGKDLMGEVVCHNDSNFLLIKIVTAFIMRKMKIK